MSKPSTLSSTICIERLKHAAIRGYRDSVTGSSHFYCCSSLSEQRTFHPYMYPRIGHGEFYNARSTTCSDGSLNLIGTGWFLRREFPVAGFRGTDSVSIFDFSHTESSLLQSQPSWDTFTTPEFLVGYTNEGKPRRVPYMFLSLGHFILKSWKNTTLKLH